MKNFSNKQKLKEYINTKSMLKEILKDLFQTGKKQEDIGWRKPQMESNHLSQYRDKKRKKKSTCESNDRHKERKKDKHEDVKKEHQNHKMWGRKVRKPTLFFYRMFLSPYNNQAKASRYSKGLSYLKNRATTNQKQTIHS